MSLNLCINLSSLFVVHALVCISAYICVHCMVCMHVYVYMCVHCVVFMHVYICVLTYVFIAWVCMYACGDWRLVQGVFFNCSPLYMLKQDLSPEPRACWSGWSRKPDCSGTLSLLLGITGGTVMSVIPTRHLCGLVGSGLWASGLHGKYFPQWASSHAHLQLYGNSR